MMPTPVMTPAEFAAAFGLTPPQAAPAALPSQPGQYIVYRTMAGDRWDTIAYAQYGDATQISALIMANPGVQIVDVLPPGTLIAVPLIAPTTPATGTTTSSPPWSS